MVVEQKRRVSQGISLRPIDKKALRYLADLDAHDSIAAAVRKLIGQRMRQEIGSDWEDKLAGIEPSEESLLEA